MKPLCFLLILFIQNSLLFGQIEYLFTQDPPQKAIQDLFLASFGSTFPYPESFLEETINEEFLMPSDWLLIIEDNQIVGCIIIDPSHSPNYIYVRHGFIKPTHFRKGLIRDATPFIENQYPTCPIFYSITRKTNNASIALHTALGFVPSTYVHEGYDPNLYTGFEYTRKTTYEEATRI